MTHIPLIERIAQSPWFRPGVVFLVLVTFTCAPIWAVDYFVNQDGSAHVYSAHLMLELIRNNSDVSDLYAFNSFSIPNSSGHWLLAVLLLFFSAYTATKIIVTLTLAGLTASVGFLRWKVRGDGVTTAMIAGAAIGFNWLWFAGFYNFLLAVIFFAVTVGLFYGWRTNLTAPRTVVLAVLLILTYFSHIVGFGILAACLGFLAITTETPNRKNVIVRTAVAFLPVVALFLHFKMTASSGAGLYPQWRQIEDATSIISWISQLRTADPFILISRRAFPFLSNYSSYFAVFTPFIWIAGAFLLLVAPTFRKLKDAPERGGLIPFLVLSSLCFLAAIFAPDDFGLNNGSILRERSMIFAFVLAVPLFQSGRRRIETAARFLLGFIVVFQTAALWEYARRTDAEAKEYRSASVALERNDQLMSIMVPDDRKRFNPTPMTGMGTYLGIDLPIIARDNYEIGHNLFPLVARDPGDKEFVHDMAAASSALLDPTDHAGASQAFDAALERNHRKITKLLVWGDASKVRGSIEKWFEPQPVFSSEHVTIFRHH